MRKKEQRSESQGIGGKGGGRARIIVLGLLLSRLVVVEVVVIMQRMFKSKLEERLCER